MSIFSEPVLTLTEAAKLLPGRPHISTLHRWRTRGVHGVKLITEKVGGRRVVAIGDLEAFIAATTAAADGKPAPTRTAKKRLRAIEDAERELDLAGITDTKKGPRDDRQQ